MEKTNINPAIYQQMLESAPNAASKGQSQFFTPIEVARSLAVPLNPIHVHAVDLNCGQGALLHGTATEDTVTLYGLDIDPKRPSMPVQFISADLTVAYPLFREVDFEADLFVLNPPWDLHWHRDRLALLGDSKRPAIQRAFAAHDGRTSRGTIDSTVATLMIALDLCSYYGEGYLIGNHSTIQRLILDQNAPHGALRNHIWAYIYLAGNPMTAPKNGARLCPSDQPQQPPHPSSAPLIDSPAPSAIDSPQLHNFDRAAETGVIYFAAAEQSGYRTVHADIDTIDDVAMALSDERWKWRRGSAVRHVSSGTDPKLPWLAVTEELKRLAGQKQAHPFNLWLDRAGFIRTGLSLFDQRKSSHKLKWEADKLHDLEGKRPMQLVMQKAERTELLQICGVGGRETPWRIDPSLVTAIEAAVAEYHASRSPLVELPLVQRLGYLDEEDQLTCVKDLYWSATSPSDHPIRLFTAGESYPLETESVTVSRVGVRPNFAGELERIEFTGQELAIYLHDNDGGKRCFMEARLQDPQEVSVSTRQQGSKLNFDFTLQQLLDHFRIPDVPDISTVHPELFQKNLAMLTELESLLS